MDILDQLPEIKIAVAYKYNGEVLESVPSSMHIMEKVEVEYKTFKGWMTDISKCRTWECLPENARIYLKFIEEFLEVPSKI